MRAQDFADLYELEEEFWWFVGMREVTAALLDPACPPAAVRRLLLRRSGLADRGSDVKPLPAGMSWLNRTRASALGAEARLLRRAGARLPAGLSAVCVVEKPRG